MQRSDRPYPYLSYITYLGDEIVLSCEDYKKWWECYGRKGFAAPRLDYETRQYADGMTDTLSVNMKPRPLEVQMVVSGESCQERDEIIADMASRLIQLGARKDWGRLKVMRSDGTIVFIDCVYVGGMDDIEQKLPYLQQFKLEFYAGNGYFFDEFETLLSTQKMTDLVYLSDDLYLANDLFLTDGVASLLVDNHGESFFPVVDVFGPASVIRIVNNTTGAVLAVEPDFLLLEGQKLTFNCREHERAIIFTDTDNTTEDVTEKLLLGASLVWEIMKGQNSITFYYTDSSEETFSRIRYRQRYFSA